MFFGDFWSPPFWQNVSGLLLLVDGTLEPITPLLPSGSTKWFLHRRINDLYTKCCQVACSWIFSYYALLFFCGTFHYDSTFERSVFDWFVCEFKQYKPCLAVCSGEGEFLIRVRYIVVGLTIIGSPAMWITLAILVPSQIIGPPCSAWETHQPKNLALGYLTCLAEMANPRDDYFVWCIQKRLR